MSSPRLRLSSASAVSSATSAIALTAAPTARSFGTTTGQRPVLKTHRLDGSHGSAAFQFMVFGKGANGWMCPLLYGRTSFAIWNPQLDASHFRSFRKLMRSPMSPASRVGQAIPRRSA